MERKPKPPGWRGTKDSKYYTKDSKYGVQYLCPYCGKKNLGIIFGSCAMHFSTCPTLKPQD